MVVSGEEPVLPPPEQAAESSSKKLRVVYNSPVNSLIHHSREFPLMSMAGDYRPTETACLAPAKSGLINRIYCNNGTNGVNVKPPTAL